MNAGPGESAFAGLVEESKSAYAARTANAASGRWWTAVVLTASSERQAEHYRGEINRRLDAGHLPSGIEYLVVADPAGQRIGSGGATVNALGALTCGVRVPFEEWWRRNRVLMIHSGGDSRRLPQYSPSGKLFGALPVPTGWSESSTVFDETMALSTGWAEQMENGLLVASGDVVLKFDAALVDWTRPGVTAVAMRQPIEVGSQHGVYALDDTGRVYAALQKPSAAQVRAAGGFLKDGSVALDSGLMRFAPAVAARITALARLVPLPPFDLYEHLTKSLTGQWQPGADDGRFFEELAAAVRNVPFHCSLVDGEFTHIGTTRHFRSIAAAAGIIDSIIPDDARLGPDSVVLECNITVPLRVGAGAILHGVAGVDRPIEVPEDVVIHQVPVKLDDATRGYVVRVYGVEDNPKDTAARVRWFGRPIEETLAALGIEAASVWPRVTAGERSLWDAELFPVCALDEAWQCVRWMLGYSPEDYSIDRWLAARKLSLADSAVWADRQAIAEERRQLTHAAWRRAALKLAEAGSDVRPLVANPPSVGVLAEVGRELTARARVLETAGPDAEFRGGPLPLTEAASRYVHGSMFLSRAGALREAAAAEAAAFSCIERAVREGAPQAGAGLVSEWVRESVEVSAPPRIDLGGGWSDTPPFCLDWGGTVLNVALELNGQYPIATSIRRIDEPIVRCVSEGSGEAVEFTCSGDLDAVNRPGCPFNIPRIALRMSGLLDGGEPLRDALAGCGGGLEIRSRVGLPVGSGLGTSSILAATVLRALAEMTGEAISDQVLSDRVMRLEQVMTTGGGWQDQAGGIFPGAKLLMTGPGLRQRIRVQPVAWTPGRKEEFCERLVLYYTGIQRIAKNLLQQVVRSYLAREVATVQVLHSIKTLAAEMAHAIAGGEWSYLGELLDRHWALNKILDPHTTNAPINAVLSEVRPFIDGAKLAGAGGGGFLILLASSPAAARDLRARLGAGVHSFRVAEDGLRVVCAPRQASDASRDSMRLRARS